MYAAINEHLELVIFLLEQGADILMQNNEQKTVLDLEDITPEIEKAIKAKYKEFTSTLNSFLPDASNVVVDYLGLPRSL